MQVKVDPQGVQLG
jgi:hypothetical protein